jgi:hypothetical protein
VAKLTPAAAKQAATLILAAKKQVRFEGKSTPPQTVPTVVEA